MAKVFGFKDQQTAERLSRLAPIKTTEYTPEPLSALLVTVELSGSLSAFSDSAAPPSATGQLISFGDSGGDTVSFWTGSDLPTVTVYNCIETAFSSGDRLVCAKMDGRYFVIQPITQAFKPLVRFTLAAALTTSDASKAATVTNQYGIGKNQVTSASGITVYNLADNTGSTYVFEGDSGDAGLAFWDSGTSYRIIQMECPA